MPIEWRYLRMGDCEFCAREDVRVRAPKLDGIRRLTPPAFCRTCAEKFAALIEQHPDPNVAIDAMWEPPC